MSRKTQNRPIQEQKRPTNTGIPQNRSKRGQKIPTMAAKEQQKRRANKEERDLLTLSYRAAKARSNLRQINQNQNKARSNLRQINQTNKLNKLNQLPVTKLSTCVPEQNGAVGQCQWVSFVPISKSRLLLFCSNYTKLSTGLPGHSGSTRSGPAASVHKCLTVSVQAFTRSSHMREAQKTWYRGKRDLVQSTF